MSNIITYEYTTSTSTSHWYDLMYKACSGSADGMIEKREILVNTGTMYSTDRRNITELLAPYGGKLHINEIAINDSKAMLRYVEGAPATIDHTKLSSLPSEFHPHIKSAFAKLQAFNQLAIELQSKIVGLPTFKFALSSIALIGVMGGLLHSALTKAKTDTQT